MLVPALFSLAVSVETWLGRKFGKFIVTNDDKPTDGKAPIFRGEAPPGATPLPAE